MPQKRIPQMWRSQRYQQSYTIVQQWLTAQEAWSHPRKVLRAASEAGLTQIIVARDQDGAGVDPERWARCVPAADVPLAMDIVAGLVGEVLTYLDVLAQTMGKLPKYFPAHFSFDAIRVNVEVSPERRRYNDTEARLWKPMCRQGTDLVYFRRREAEGRVQDDGRERERQPMLVSWDERTGEKFPRAVILGDPGLGKTWVLRFEARHLARTMATQLRHQEIGLQAGRVPIFARLGDVARILRDLQETWRHQGRSDEVPLEEALIALIQRDYRRVHKDDRGEEYTESFSTMFFAWLREQLAHQRCVAAA